MTHHDLATIELAAYSREGADPSASFDFWQDGKTDNDVAFGVKRVDGITVIAFPGSRTIRDWFRDFTAVADPFTHDRLGPVHVGFQAGMSGVWKWVQANTQGPRVVIGHSLGAARATILTGYMCADGQPPIARVVWGEPKSCFAQMAQLIQGVPSTSYRNGEGFHHDIVTDVPITLLVEEYVRCGVLTRVSAPPPPGQEWGLLGWHHLDLYLQACPETLLEFSV